MRGLHIISQHHMSSACSFNKTQYSIEGPHLVSGFPVCFRVFARPDEGFTYFSTFSLPKSFLNGEQQSTPSDYQAPGISASPSEDNMRYFNVMILGPTQSPYEGSETIPILRTLVMTNELHNGGEMPQCPLLNNHNSLINSLFKCPPLPVIYKTPILLFV
ncbi:uncharacterized protein LOC131241020 isoform X2 [Magnolia sinica]|uniref:uncharacterized protein LOC131241020 isoform X2 n=1 Tax=Magnolia sinica TaxID=86752 RepID=UPI00265A278E|nr:uncharacterized protein LOC131241020 isoform X2 [Magnolia sinica]